MGTPAAREGHPHQQTGFHRCVLEGMRCGIITIDERGTVIGLAFREDALEEIVGPLGDEFYEQEGEFEEVEDGVYEIAGRMSVPETCDRLDFELSDEEDEDDEEDAAEDHEGREGGGEAQHPGVHAGGLGHGHGDRADGGHGRAVAHEVGDDPGQQADGQQQSGLAHRVGQQAHEPAAESEPQGA